MRILIIANPLVGILKDKKAVVEEITSRITRQGGTVDITYIINPGMGQKHSSRAALEGYDAVYAAGGDGTINDVASGLIGRSISMGIIPLGTGNGCARGLGIPLYRDDFIDVLLNKKITAIDVGKIGSRIFLSTAGIGYDANIAHDFNQLETSRRNMQKFFFLAVKNYFLKCSENVKLIFDGKEMNRTVFGLTICNTPQYGGGAIIAPQASPSSGKLIAVLIPKFTLFKAPLAIYKLFNGSLTEYKDLEYISFNTLKIIRPQEDLVQVDGESFKGDKILTVSVEPLALNIITP